MLFPGFENIFSLGEPFATRPFRGSLREAAAGLDIYALAIGRVLPARAVRIVPYGGRHPADFIWTDSVGIRLVSQRVLDLFQESRISGWSTFPVDVYDQNDQRIGGFEGFSVTGRCGKIDPGLSTQIQKSMPGGGFPHFRGYFFKPESWDGAHIFGPEGTTDVLVTQVVRDLLRQSKVSNVEYRPIREIEFTAYEKTLMEEKLTQG